MKLLIIDLQNFDCSFVNAFAKNVQFVDAYQFSVFVCKFFLKLLAVFLTDFDNISISF